MTSSPCGNLTPLKVIPVKYSRYIYVFKILLRKPTECAKNISLECPIGNHFFLPDRMMKWSMGLWYLFIRDCYFNIILIKQLNLRQIEIQIVGVFIHNNINGSIEIISSLLNFILVNEMSSGQAQLVKLSTYAIDIYDLSCNENEQVKMRIMST